MEWDDPCSIYATHHSEWLQKAFRSPNPEVVLTVLGFGMEKRYYRVVPTWAITYRSEAMEQVQSKRRSYDVVSCLSFEICRKRYDRVVEKTHVATFFALCVDFYINQHTLQITIGTQHS